MNVRKIIDSYEQGKSPSATRPSPRTSAHRPRPRPRTRTLGTEPSPVMAGQRPPRSQRPPNLKIVKEERPVAIVLKECMNELQAEQKSNPPRVSVPLTSDANRNCGHSAITSAELLCTLAPPFFGPSGASPVVSIAPASSWDVSAKLAQQQRVRTRRQQRYSRDESALAVALRRTAEYERIFPPKPSIQYATKQLELRVRDAKAHLAELRELLRDDTTDRETHQAALRARWMLERWIKSAENELTRPNTATGSLTPDPVGPSTQNIRRDANLAYFFAHSPTRTTASPKTKHRYSSTIEQPRRISKHNVEPPQLRTWPLTSALRAPIKLKTMPSTPTLFVTSTERSVAPVPPHNVSSSPEPQHSHDVDLISPLAEPSPPPQGTYSSSFPVRPDTPLDDSRTRTWHGFAVIYVPSQPSDEELLAVLGADMETQPMPEYVSYLLNQLEPIGEDVVLPGLSRKESTTSSGFEFISRPSIEAYDYPFLPRSRLLVRRSMRFSPQGRPRLGVMSGLRVACESHSPQSPPSSPSRPAGQELASPRSGVFSKMRRSMAARGHQ